ncbi:MAG: PIN domain-containing protein [Lachnospiraceae bacterium]|nr:PIN domain-containing protein [Lachnospiraceae bacterium]
MKIKIFAVIDTNVLVSSAISQKSFPYDIMQLINSGNVIPIFDGRMLNEYYKVFDYDKFKGKDLKMPLFSKEDVYDILYSVVSNGIFIDDVKETEIYFSDIDDIPFFEVKMSSDEFDPYLVTGNEKHFPKTVSVVTPKEMLSIMKYLERFLSKDENYDKVVQDLIQRYISTPKYTSGTSLLEKIFDKENKVIRSSFFEK